jgi:phosphohistidine phosphatase SixA
MDSATTRRPNPRWAILAAVSLLLVQTAGARAQGQALQPRLVGQELLAALQQGGLVILMRHTATDDFVPEDGTHDDVECATQRNLNEQGKREAKEIGAAIQRLGIPVGPVLTSTYCRCVETGMLAFGEVGQVEELAVFDELSASEKDARGKQIRKMLNDPPPPGHNTFLITHTGTLLYSFGLQTRPEGIAHVFRPAEFGQAIYLGRLEPSEWATLGGPPES